MYNSFSIISEGLVGGEYYFYDTMTAVPFRVKFDVEEVFQDLARKNLLGGVNERFVYAPDYKIKNQKLYLMGLVFYYQEI